jgi:DNA repair protein RadC
MRTKNNSRWEVARLKISHKQKTANKVKVSDSYSAYKVFKQMWNKSLIDAREQFCALFLDYQERAIAFSIISTGTENMVKINLPLLFDCAKHCGADSIITAHNHPGGYLEPSEADEGSARRTIKAANDRGYILRDDLIISEKSFYSLSDNLNPAFDDQWPIEQEEEELLSDAIKQPKKKSFSLFGVPLISVES